MALSGVASCTWIDDEADRARRDRDGDGVPMSEDCNDENGSVAALPKPDQVIACGEVVEAEVSRAERLGTSTCLHPLRSGEELAQYGPNEDLWSLTVEGDGEVDVVLSPRDDFTQTAVDFDLDLAGVVLWAWPEGDCPREHCNLGLPLANADNGRLPGPASVRFDAGDASEWVLVVTAAAGSGYTLSVACPP